MEHFFHCSARARKNVKKSKHRISECCDTVKIVLSTNPEYGALIKGSEGLRKMRVKAPSLNVGKSGGYRLIYKASLIDEVWRIVLMATYFKGDCEDLPESDYKDIRTEALAILSDIESVDWDLA